MKKSLRRVLSLCFGATMLFSAVACGDGGNGGSSSSSSSISSSSSSSSSSGGGNQPQIYNTETRPLVFSIGALDQNFNPFFSTSAMDTEVIGMTQIGMLATSSESDKPVCGDDEATVALDYTEKMFDKNGLVSQTGDMEGRTEYEFLIKNGIKFSDGTPLTIKDVLFNLYVYLDPAYSGSATMYSTDIKGLKKYRYQDPTITDDAEVDGDSAYQLTAMNRIYMIKAYCGETEYDSYYPMTNEDEAKVMQDLRTIKDKFYEELNTDWNNNLGAVESKSYPEYTFTEDWQSYLLNAGIVNVKTGQMDNGKYGPLKDVNGKYITTLDDNDSVYADEVAAYVAENWEDYQADKGCSEADAKAAMTKEWAINTVYGTYCSNYNYKDPDNANFGDDDNTRVADILDAWATGSEIFQLFTNEARSDYFATMTERVKHIDGVSTYQTTTFNGVQLGETHDVLKIVINGVDPKAIYNFAFAVAPMHYYSDPSVYNDVENYPYGVKTGDADFFQKVLQANEKNGLPVGAGVYKASNAYGGSGTIDRTTFFEDNVVYFQRNTYFDTVGGDEVYNAKIKYVNYKVVSEANIMNALQTKAIDYGAPNAKQENIARLSESGFGHLDYTKYLTGGYGYVGINPKFVPSVAVRRVIMKAMDRNKILDYYGNLAELINRPMSKTSWAYNKEAWTSLPASVSFTANTATLIGLLEDAGYTAFNANGVRYNPSTGDVLKYKFTIAGETVDHPAYGMFNDAAETLRECGFDITVGTDVQALKKLATGGLQVWAAAWSSAIDPDMYQVYHKDSTATSVKNWNYDEIKDPNNTKYSYEYGIVVGYGDGSDLSSIIEWARETTNKDTRKQRYEQALDLVMQLAVELPTYQRNDLVIFNKEVINANTLNKNVTWPDTVISQMWKLNYN